MEMTVRMPANYNLLAEEEMTYTTGGATAVQALCAWFLPFYGWIPAWMLSPRTWSPAPSICCMTLPALSA